MIYTNKNSQELEILARPISDKDIESIIKYLTTRKNPGPDTNSFTAEFYQTFKELTLICLKLI